MFSFNNASVPTEGMIAEVDGTQGVYLKKAEYTEPTGKTPRIELHLEKPMGGVVQKQTILINDYTFRGAKYDKQPQQELDRLFSLITTYNPDKSREELAALVGEQETWKELCNAVIAQLPPNYPEIKTSWFLRYRPGTDLMTLPNVPPFVKLGDAKFKSNPQYDSFTPTKQEMRPSGLDEFNDAMSNTQDDSNLFDEPVGSTVDRVF